MALNINQYIYIFIGNINKMTTTMNEKYGNAYVRNNNGKNM